MDSAKELHHRAYREAGSHLVECNSFGGSRCKLEEYGLGKRTDEINQAVAAVAKDVAGEDQFVLGSIGPTGEFMEPLGELEEDEMIEIFREQAGADVVVPRRPISPPSARPFPQTDFITDGNQPPLVF